MNATARWIAIVLIPVLLAPLAAQDPAPSVSGETLRRWTDDLDHPEYARRQAATQQLVEAGVAAVPVVRAAAESASLEVVMRSLYVLSRLSLQQNADAERLASDALAELAASSDRRVAGRAREELHRQRRRWIRRLERLGASVSESAGVVTAISFSGEVVRDDDLSLLRRFPEVVSLSLGGTNIGDAGMKHVACLRKLERLDLYRTQVGDDGLRHIKNLPHLKSLPMGETRVTDAGLAHVQDMTQLEYLGLRGDDITDAGLVHLQKLKNLTGLYLGETKVTDAGLPRLSHLEEMGYLRLHTMRVSDAGLVHLRGMKRLTRLDIYNTDITDDGVSRLKQWFPRCNIVHTQ